MHVHKCVQVYSYAIANPLKGYECDDTRWCYAIDYRSGCWYTCTPHNNEVKKPALSQNKMNQQHQPKMECVFSICFYLVLRDFLPLLLLLLSTVFFFSAGLSSLIPSSLKLQSYMFYKHARNRFDTSAIRCCTNCCTTPYLHWIKRIFVTNYQWIHSFFSLLLKMTVFKQHLDRQIYHFYWSRWQFDNSK